MEFLTAVTLAELWPLVYTVLLLVAGTLGGYLAGVLVARLVTGMLKRNLGRLLSETDLGRTFARMGVDIFSLIGGLIKAFVFSIVFLAAIEQVSIEGASWKLLYQVALYLPRLVGGIAVLLLGLLLASALSKYTGRLIREVVGESRVAKLVETMLVISLLVVVITIALNLMMLEGDMFYPLMLGIIMMVSGIYLGEILVDELTSKHENFAVIAPFAKFTIYLVFLTTGLAAIFAKFVNVTSVIVVLAWGVVAAIVLTLAPLVLRVMKSR